MFCRQTIFMSENTAGRSTLPTVAAHNISQVRILSIPSAAPTSSSLLHGIMASPAMVE